MSSERSTGGAIAAKLEPFQYRQTDGHTTDSNLANGELPWDAPAATVDAKKLIEQAEKRGFDRGLRDGQEQAKAAYETNLNATRKLISTAIEQFKNEREAYFNRTEPEVVHLALAIARKILHREAQMDPLLLMGAVHVALEKLEAGSRVRLRAHPDDVRKWVNSFSQWNTSAAPEIIGDPALQPGECALETELGSTHLSLETQLKEIEQGFMDLLEQRPRVR